MEARSHIDLETFRRGYLIANEAFNRHDFEAAFGALPDDFEWHLIGRWGDAPYTTGPGEILRMFADLTGSLPDYRVEPQEFIDAGEGRFVICNVGIGTGRASGVPTRIDFVQLWEYDGLTPLRVREYDSLEEAMKAAGRP